MLGAICTGRMTVGDAARAYGDFLDHAHAPKTRFVLCDLRALEQFDVFLDGGEHLADLIAGDSGRQPVPWHIAVLLRWKGQFPMARHLAMQIDQKGPARCRTFVEPGQAIDWMGADRAVLGHRLASQAAPPARSGD